MKESYSEVLARHAGREPYADDGNVVGVAWGRGTRRPSMELRNQFHPVCRPCSDKGKAISLRASLASTTRTRRSRRPGACVETPSARTGRSHRFPNVNNWGRSANLSEGTADVDAGGKSDSSIVRAKRANKAGTPVAEFVEEREPPEGSDASFAVVPDSEPDHATGNADWRPRHVGASMS